MNVWLGVVRNPDARTIMHSNIEQAGIACKKEKEGKGFRFIS